MSDPLQVATEVFQGTLWVRLAGELDAAAAPELRAEIDSWAPGPTTVDLSRVTFIDSTGIGCLLRLQQKVAEAGEILMARGSSPSVRRTLEITGLHRLIALVD